ncbi:MAG: dGTPase, partial [Idiomarina sp.]|nr:dGTPase [Idiomarina sp.]
EYKGQMMILKLFQVLSENPERLLPESTLRQYKNSDNPKRVICDYISGMTDNYATKLYSKLFSPDTGSVFDKV